MLICFKEDDIKECIHILDNRIGRIERNTIIKASVLSIFLCICLNTGMDILGYNFNANILYKLIIDVILCTCVNLGFKKLSYNNKIGKILEKIDNLKETLEILSYSDGFNNWRVEGNKLHVFDEVTREDIHTIDVKVRVMSGSINRILIDNGEPLVILGDYI